MRKHSELMFKWGVETSGWLGTIRLDFTNPTNKFGDEPEQYP